MRALLAVIVFVAWLALVWLFAGCGDDGQVDDQVDAGELGACVPASQRDVECKQLCGPIGWRCEGATGGACWSECAMYASGTAYCPVEP